MYPYLPEGRMILYVPITDPFMAEAAHLRNIESTDALVPTGAVVVQGEIIIGKGANQTPIKNKKLQEFHKDHFCVRRFLKIPSGQKYWLCPGCAKHHHHAEARAVRDAQTKKGDTQGADLYLYGHWWCCQPCWDSMIKAGIRNVYLVDNATQQFKRS